MIVALGNGTSLGGEYDSAIHLDGARLEPTVTIDGETDVERGRFTVARWWKSGKEDTSKRPQRST